MSQNNVVKQDNNSQLLTVAPNEPSTGELDPFSRSGKLLRTPTHDRKRPKPDSFLSDCGSELSFVNTNIEENMSSDQVNNEWMEKMSGMMTKMMEEMKVLKDMQSETDRNVSGVREDIKSASETWSSAIEKTNERIQKIEERLGKIENASGSVYSKEVNNEIVEMKMRFSSLERQAIKNNIIVKAFGEKKDKTRVFDTISKTTIGREAKTSEITGIAENENFQMFKVKILNSSDKDEIMKNRIKLKGSDIIIQHDETYNTRMLKKKIRNEAQKNFNAKKVIIRNKKVIIDGKVYEWNEREGFKEVHVQGDSAATSFNRS